MRILIVHATAGAGHKKAAEALHKAFLEKLDEKEVAIIDSLDYTNNLFKWAYGSQYLTLVTHLPDIWGFFYYILDNPIVYRLLWPVRRFINYLNTGRLVGLLLNDRPEVIVTTHFMANEVISRLKQKGIFDGRLFTAVTDFRLHSFWTAGGVDCYMVATESAKKDLAGRGIQQEKILITGVPIDPKFSKGESCGVLCKRLQIKEGLFTVLIAGGGFGIGPIESIVNEIGNISHGIQLLAVCGRNQALKASIEKKAKRLKSQVRVFGFVDNIDELMQVSSILVSKSGGLTMSEALAKGLPAVIVGPIPGQELRNSRVLKDCGAAFVVKNARSAKRAVMELYNNPRALKDMKQAAGKIARPDSAREIVKLVLTQILPACEASAQNLP